MMKANSVAPILESLKALYPYKSNKVLGALFGRTEKAVSSIAKRYGLRKAEDYLMPGAWSSDHITYLEENFRTLSYPAIAKYLDRRPGTVAGMAFKLGLKRTPQEQKAIDEKYNTGCFKPGSVPANKGLKGVSYEGCRATQFRKGQLPKNTLHNGAITIRNDNRGVPQQYIRVALSRWVYLSRWTWEQYYGPIPKGMLVAFKDKNTLNCAVENLELITRKQNALRNSGSVALTDRYVASTMTHRNPDLRQEILQMPELISLKRTLILLNRSIRHESNRPA